MSSNVCASNVRAGRPRLARPARRPQRPQRRADPRARGRVRGASPPTPACGRSSSAAAARRSAPAPTWPFMREVGGYTWEQNRADAETLAEMLWTLYTCPVPVIARIHGDCYAGGLGIASVCDIRVVAEGVNFSLSEARLGLLPATISPYVVRAMGEQAARRYFVTAERFGAAEAKAMGFAHEVCAAEALDAKVERARRGARRQRADGRPAPARSWCRTSPAARSRRAARRDGAADRRHPRQRRRQGRRLQFPRKRKPNWSAPADHEPRPDPARRDRRRARLGQRAAPLCRGLPHRHGRLRSAGSTFRAAWTCCRTRGVLGASGLLLFVEFFVDKIPGPRQRLGRAPHRDPDPRRRGAGGRGLRRRRGHLDHRRGAARRRCSPPPATSPRRPPVPPPTPRPSRSRTSPSRCSATAWCLSSSGCRGSHPVLLFVTLGAGPAGDAGDDLGSWRDSSRRAASAVALRYRRPMPPAAHSEVTR